MIPGHSLPLATIGVFLLWLGWFGFNGGSVLSASPGAVSYVFVTTTLAACGGVMSAMLVSWLCQKKPDLSMVLNGSLAGLAGITAGADVVSVSGGIISGLVAGGLVVLSVIFVDRVLKWDDPVGAIPVHLFCRIWGSLAVGIFSSDPKISITTQALGVLAYPVVAFPSACLIFYTLKKWVGIRVPWREENLGLDILEHGMEAYSGFQIFRNQ